MYSCIHTHIHTLAKCLICFRLLEPLTCLFFQFPDSDTDREKSAFLFSAGLYPACTLQERLCGSACSLFASFSVCVCGVCTCIDCLCVCVHVCAVRVCRLSIHSSFTAVSQVVFHNSCPASQSGSFDSNSPLPPSPPPDTHTRTHIHTHIHLHIYTQRLANAVPPSLPGH